MKFFTVIGILFFSINLYSQENQNKSKIIYLTHFNSYKSQKSEAISGKIYKNLEEEFKALGYEVRESTSDLSTTLSVAKANGAKFVIDGYYKLSETGGLNIYSQIYNPDTGYMIDALNITDELYGAEGISLDPKETQKSTDSSIEDFKKKIVIRIRTNTKRIERRDNINEAVTTTALGKDKDLKFPIAEENVASASAEVFKILAEKETVSVASNVIKDAKKQPVSVSIISRQQIKMSGARTLNEVLNMYVPGFFSVDDQDDNIAGFRGFAPDNNAKVLLLINGHNMNTEWFWGPPDSIINGMNLDYIEKVEVIRGPGSVTLGQGALLGVINIITRNADTHKGVQLSGTAGQNNYKIGTISAGMTGQENKDLKVYFQASNGQYHGQTMRNEGWAHTQTNSGAEGYYNPSSGYYALTGKPSSTDLVLGTTNIPGYIPDPVNNPNTTNPQQSLVLQKNIASEGVRLKRAYNDVVNGVIQYKGLEINTMYNNQLRDLYNFYRDRSKIGNTVKHGALTYNYEINDKISIKFKNYYTQDDVSLVSQNGLTLGGTRENRYGGSVILNLNDVLKDHNIAIGTEFRKYDMGQRNADGNNFILNYSQNTSDNALLIDRNGLNPNQRNRYVYPGSIAVKSFFMEDFYKLNEKIDLFGAFRYDRHPYWGSNFAPRVGALYAATSNLRFRVSYQEGFRGAIGASYVGGFQGDGHLRIQNFPYIGPSAIPNGFDSQGYPNSYYSTVPETKPEKMKSSEVAINYNLTTNLSIEGIFFYNRVQKITDVGVLYCNSPSAPTASTPGPNGCNMPNLGSDIPGNWNGYWFYKNNPGEIRQGGTEISINYKVKHLTLTFSESIVKLLSSSTAQGNSSTVYLTSDPNNRQFLGYPSNVSRLHGSFTPFDKWTFTAAILYYPSWYAPNGQRVIGNNIANLGVNFRMLENLDFHFIFKNAFNAGNLYPMIANAGGYNVSQGTPAVEKRTYWFGVNYSF